MTTTSPEVNIEPGHVRRAGVGAKVGGDLILPKPPDGQGHRVPDAGTEGRGQFLELPMCRDVDTYARAGHALMLAGVHACPGSHLATIDGERADQ